ncbi:MAG TPA: hypothetical protein EYP59_01310 [Thiotrichaceae bacterium]|nr:hypothetical protein [Thiotrichaceae bacterium]
MPVPSEKKDGNPVYGDFVNLPGVAGQNTRTPSEKVFHDHWIVKVELDQLSSKPYYDPSYGLVYENKEDFEKNALYGFGAYLAVEDEKDKKPPGTYNYRRKTISGKGLIFKEYKYSEPILINW